jgi:predicted nucleic acid-binding protein
MTKLRIFLDADVIFAGSAAPTQHSASHIILQLGELTLVDCVTSQQVVTEVERNMGDKLPSKLAELQLILSRSLRMVPDPTPQEIRLYIGQADPKDVPILVAAVQAGCSILVTFNIRHFTPKTAELAVQRPGEFVKTVRTMLSQLSQV